MIFGTIQMALNSKLVNQSAHILNRPEHLNHIEQLPQTSLPTWNGASFHQGYGKQTLQEFATGATTNN